MPERGFLDDMSFWPYGVPVIIFYVFWWWQASLAHALYKRDMDYSEVFLTRPVQALARFSSGYGMFLAIGSIGYYFYVMGSSFLWVFVVASIVKTLLEEASSIIPHMQYIILIGIWVGVFTMVYSSGAVNFLLP